MNELREKLLELKHRGWTMAAVADGLGVSHMTVFRWQNGLRNAQNSRSVMYMLESLLNRKRIPKLKRRADRTLGRNSSSESSKAR